MGGTLPIGIGAVAPAASGSRGQQIAALASAELGVAEQPPGSNDAPRIAEYRTATAGAAAGQPWCAYFTSWVAAQAGVPIGPDGQGLGYVPTVKQWAEQTGRYIPAGAGSPQVGDLVVFDRGGDGVLDHIGVVTGASPDGSIQTVEGNSSNARLGPQLRARRLRRPRPPGRARHLIPRRSRGRLWAWEPRRPSSPARAFPGPAAVSATPVT